MEPDPWKDIKPKTESLIPPEKVIEKLFSGLGKYSSDKVGFQLNKVDFFPEEVTYSSDNPVNLFWSGKTKNPHPDFGYNPQFEKNLEYFRYRLLLFPASRYEIKYELFKFKYPILFYPVTLYIDKKSFNLLDEHIPEKFNLEAENVTVLEDYIKLIIRSESTNELISRLKAL